MLKADSWEQGVQTLLAQSRICFLSTRGKQGPETSMAPYALHGGNILLHLSGLAKHFSNIKTSPDIGLMICTPETAGESPLGLPRLSLQGVVAPVSDGLLERAKAVYLARLPDAEPLFAFADFRLFQFEPEHIHWVGGFGKARTVSLAQWRKLVGCS